jgi:hypothetical protein
MERGIEKITKFKNLLLITAFVLCTGIYLSSGTLAPYATQPLEGGILPSQYHCDCQYLQNIDHFHHKAAFYLIDGKDRSQWEHSVVLRRILFPLLAYPFMKLFTYEIGGVLASIILNVLVFIIFIKFIRKKYSLSAAKITMWLLALYPGITYWAGLPYSYTCIVPFTLIGTMLLHKINENDNVKTLLTCSFYMGILFLGYDLITFFLPATLYILSINRKFKYIPLAVMVMFVPGLLSMLIFRYLFDIGAMNDNTLIYKIIFDSYLEIFRHITDISWLTKWLSYIFIEKNFLLILVNVFFKSNFYSIPALFLLVFVYARIIHKIKLSTVESSIVFSTILLFCFNNLAPAYGGWQMRGDWISRIYQPVFIVYILYLARFYDFQMKKQKIRARNLIISVYFIVVFFNSSIVFGPITKNPLSETVYFDFYVHGKKEMITKLNKYGRVPVGLCELISILRKH